MDSPAVPKPLGTDEEDVAWALATAEAMWARGDRLDAVKWIRKAAEAASEADDILRAAELASAAADLANALDPALSAPPPAANRAALNKTMQSHKSQVPGGAPPAKAAPPVPVRSAPELRRPSPPTGMLSIKNIHQRPAATASPRPGVTAPRAPATPSPSPAQRVAPLTGARKPEPAPLDATAELAALPPAPRSSRPSTPPPRPSTRPPPARPSSPAPRALGTSPSNAPPPAEGWDLPHTVQLPPTRPVVDTPPEFVDPAKLGAAAPTGTTPSGGRVGPVRPKVNTMTEVDREVPAEVGRRAARLQASQAFHVVLWKDARGVHVAPSGTVVSAITVDAILIALDPSADLSAWLQPGSSSSAGGE